jgi:hypothetical protein
MDNPDHTDEELQQLLEHVQELEGALARAAKLVSELPRSRAASLIATKVDEAKLWLTRVELVVDAHRDD